MEHDYFWLDGVRCDEVGLRMQGPIIFSNAKPKVTTESVPGRNGDLHYYEGAYENVTGEGRCYVASLGYVDKALSAVAKWCLMEPGYHRLETTDEMEYYRIPWLEEHHIRSLIKSFVGGAEQKGEDGQIAKKDKKEYVLGLLRARGIEITPEIDNWVEDAVLGLDKTWQELLKEFLDALKKQNTVNPSGIIPGVVPENTPGIVPDEIIAGIVPAQVEAMDCGADVAPDAGEA